MTFDLVSILAQDSGGSSPLGMLILFVPLGLLLYMMIVPQRKQKQKQADMLRKLDVGDEVLTTGGIVGVITFIEDDLFHLEVDTDVVIRVARSAIARSTSDPEPTERPSSRSRKAKGEGSDAGAGDESSE
ncbi:MAG: preprotein translocase subunit YajC [Microthrixaceae bacterium]